MLFINRDIETDDEGEIQVSNGDLVLASAERTAIQLVNFVALTNWGDYTPQPQVGGNLGTYIGQLNITRTHLLMRSSLTSGYQQQGIFDRNSIRVAVEPTGDEEAGVLLMLQVDFGEPIEDRAYGSPILAYRFPFLTAQIEKVEVDDLP